MVRPNRLWDVVIVGAGPSGSAAAAFLAERGFETLIIDRSEFPRPKACAEYVSPEALRILDRLGVLEDLRSTGSPLGGMMVTTPTGTTFEGRFSGASKFRGFSDVGLGVRREILDQRLLETSIERGAQFRPAVRADSIHQEGDRVIVRVSGARTAQSIAARMAIAADGIRSRIARCLGLARRRGPQRIAYVAHAVDVSGMRESGEMFVTNWGYLGLAPVGAGVTNVSVVIDSSSPGTLGRPSWEYLHEFIGSVGPVRERFRSARFVTPTRAVGPFGSLARRATADRVALVGDAADFYDPFTGEGIYAALRGAELLDAVLAQRLSSDRLDRTSLEVYDRHRAREFRGKWLVERIVSHVISRPRLFEHVARRLAAKRELSDLLVGVTGDFVPPTAILSPAYFLRLVW